PSTQAHGREPWAFFLRAESSEKWGPSPDFLSKRGSHASGSLLRFHPYQGTKAWRGTCATHAFLTFGLDSPQGINCELRGGRGSISMSLWGAEDQNNMSLWGRNPDHSCRRASMGSRREARRAGYQPNSTPTPMETPKEK